jgi:hypothetical protein
MTKRRIGSLIAVIGAALALFGCTGSVGGWGGERGFIRARVSFPPGQVQSVFVTATRDGFSAGASMDGAGSSWSGGQLSVPPGSGYVVTAYAFSGFLPEDPVHNTTGLVYKGQVQNVDVSSNETAQPTIVLIPWPDAGPQPGINTPPHIVFGSHPGAILSTDTVELSAAAWDPDPETSLSFSWDDGAAGGTFSGRDGQTVSGQLPGSTVSVYYTPAGGFVGTVTIRLVVSDGTAAVYQTLTMDVQGGTGTIAPTLVFDSGPEVAITAITSQSLAPLGTTQISYQVTGGSGTYNVIWADDCAGHFGGYGAFLLSGNSDLAEWQAPEAPPQSPGRCNLKLNVVDGDGAYTWVPLVVWVDSSQDQPYGKVVFTTSDTVQAGYFNADPARADSLCQTAASRGGLPGTYKAFMSFATVNAKDRISEGPYHLPDGTPVASSKADLLDGSLLHALDLDESRNVIGGEEWQLEVWTGTGPDGTLYGSNLDLYQCSDWTTSSSEDAWTYSATGGSVGLTDAGWTFRETNSPWWYWCSDYKHVYCFQQ